MKKYNFIKYGFGWIFKILYRMRVVNPENFPTTDKPYIICANHSHLFDVVPMVVYTNRKIRFMAKKEVFHTPFLKGLAKIMGAYGVDRGAGDIAALKKTIEILKGGDCIGVFPQGTRCSYIDPRDTEPKEGIGMIASRAGVGILPVCIRTKRNRMSLFRKTELVIGKYLSPEDLAFPELSGMEKNRKIANVAFDQICEMNNVIERKPLPPERIAKIQEEIDRKTHKHK
jgi:1-acyl-sn-glycerol-3-phosphate acyltransferase